MKQKSRRNKVAISLKEIRGGTPCLAGTRIPIQKVAYLYKVKKIPLPEIALKYYTQLSIDQIKQAIEWFDSNKEKYGMAFEDGHIKNKKI